MADTPLTTSNANVSGALKRMYEDLREDVFPILTPFWAQLEKAKKGGARNIRWGSDGIRWDVVLTAPTNGTASNSGWLPVGDFRVERQTTMPIATVYHTRSILRRAARAIDTKKAAFISFQQKLMEEATQSQKMMQQEIVHGDGRGIKAVVSSRTNDTTYVIYRPFGMTDHGQGALLVHVGSYLVFNDVSASNARLGAAKVVSVTPSGDTATIVIDTAVSGVAAGDLLTSGTENDSALDQYPYGVHNWLNIGGNYDDFIGINAATAGQELWDAVQLTAGSSAVPSTSTPDESDIWHLINRIAGISGHDAQLNSEEYFMSTTPGLYKAMGQSFIGQRYLDQEQVANHIKGGFKTITICGVQLIKDQWQHAGTIYLVHRPSIARFHMDDFAPLVFENTGPWRWQDGRDGYSIHWAEDLNLAPTKRNASGCITGFDDVERFTHVADFGH